MNKFIVIMITIMIGLLITVVVIEETKKSQVVDKQELLYVTEVPQSTTFIKAGNIMTPIVHPRSFKAVYNCLMEGGEIEEVSFTISESEYHKLR